MASTTLTARFKEYSDVQSLNYLSKRSANSSNICFLDGLHRYVSNGTIELANFCFGVKPFVDPEVGRDEWDQLGQGGRCPGLALDHSGARCDRPT